MLYIGWLQINLLKKQAFNVLLNLCTYFKNDNNAFKFAKCEE